MLWLHWKRMPPWADRGLSYCRFCRNRTGLMLAMQEHYQFSDEEIIRALFNASAIGYLAMRNATVAGAVADARPR